MWLLVIFILSLGGILAIFGRRFFLVVKSEKGERKDVRESWSFKKSILQNGFFLLKKLGGCFLYLRDKSKQIIIYFYKLSREGIGRGQTRIVQFFKTRQRRRQRRTQPVRLLKKIKRLKKREAFKREGVAKDAALSKAEIFLNLKDYYTAEKYAFQAIQKDPKAKENYVFLARLYVLQNNFADAAQCIEQAVKLGERELGILLLGGEAFLKWQKRDKCYRMFKRALRVASNKKSRARVVFRWGLACKEFGDQEQAKKFLEEAVALDEEKAEYKRALQRIK